MLPIIHDLFDILIQDEKADNTMFYVVLFCLIKHFLWQIIDIYL